MSRSFLVYNFNGRTDAKHSPSRLPKLVNLSLNISQGDLQGDKTSPTNEEIYISDQSVLLPNVVPSTKRVVP
jgi:hypothetical protein